MTKKELYAVAREMNIAGRSTMNKAELSEAVRAATTTPTTNPVTEEVAMSNPQNTDYPADTLVLDWSEYTLEEAELLNMEVTPEIEALLEDLRDEKHGVPEVLYDDAPIPLSDGPDMEAELNNMITLQERMARGMGMIKQVSNQVDFWFAQNKWFVKVWYAWKCRDNLAKVTQITSHWKYPMQEKDALRFLQDKRNEKYFNTFAYRAKLWNHWWVLKGECDAIAAEYPQLWHDYFKLINEPIDGRFVTADPEDFDTQQHLVINDSIANPCVLNLTSGFQLIRTDWKDVPQRRLDGEIEGFLSEMNEYAQDNAACSPGDLYKPYQWLVDNGIIKENNYETFVSLDPTYVSYEAQVEAMEADAVSEEGNVCFAHEAEF